MNSDIAVNIDVSLTNNQKLKQQWLDKLWSHLFDGEASGLMSPGQIIRERRNRNTVRKLEMAALFEAEQDVNKIHQGLKVIDHLGNLINTPPVDSVKRHSIIESAIIDSSDDVGLETAGSMLRAAVKDVSIRDLERALNLRKIIILAESEIYNAQLIPISHHSVVAEWLLNWKLSAQDIFNPEIQVILARMLIKEIAAPGSFSMGSIHSLKLLSPNELEMVSILSKFSFGSFIYNASTTYFDSELYDNLFECMDDLGFVAGVGLDPMHKTFKSERSDSFKLSLCCGAKVMIIQHSDPYKRLTLAVYKVGRVARQIMSLQSVGSDLAYLFEVAAYIKRQGFNVTLGEWDNKPGKKRVFIEKMSL